MESRRDAVPFDPYHFEKLARRGLTAEPEVIFRDIYARHHWAGSASPSGAGAAPEQVQQLRAELPALLERLGIATLLDLPCGDASWVRTLELPVQRYIGADLLPELIAPLVAAHADARHRFLVLDLTRDELPCADLMLCRDCLVHLSYADSRRALANVARSGIPSSPRHHLPGDRGERGYSHRRLAHDEPGGRALLFPAAAATAEGRLYRSWWALRRQEPGALAGRGSRPLGMAHQVSAPGSGSCAGPARRPAPDLCPLRPPRLRRR